MAQTVHTVQLSQLTKKYGKVAALDSLSLEIPAGNVVGLMGENGCGKTTLLKILAGVLTDYSGEARVAGMIPGPSMKARTSYLPDSSAVPARLTGEQVADMYANVFVNFNRDKALAKLRYFGVPSDRPGKTLSKGQREKMQVAMAMAREADFYFLDEPLSGVDPAARDQILGGILEDLRDDALMIISTHLIQDIEAIVSHAVFMHQGKVRLSGDADELREQHGCSLDALFRQMYSWQVA